MTARAYLGRYGGVWMGYIGFLIGIICAVLDENYAAAWWAGIGMIFCLVAHDAISDFWTVSGMLERFLERGQ